MQTKYNLITILGHTAGGKTSVATHLAKKLDGEILSADSRQVYRKMDIGTGKDLDDYDVEGQKIPFHLIDIVDAGYKYNVFEFQHDFFEAYQDIISRHKTAIMCGGTGMYLDSVLKGYKLIQVPVNENLRTTLEAKTLDELRLILNQMKEMHNKTDVDTKKRAIRAIEIETYYNEHPQIDTNLPEVNSLLVGINFDRNSRRKRITQRLEERLNTGMIQEVEQLLQSGITPENLIYYGLEYKFLTLYITGQISYNKMFTELEKSIHQFAKRQMTWFRGMERKGFDIKWIDGYTPMEEKLNMILNWYKK